MPFNEVTEPVPGQQAFEQKTDAAVLSQAAVLLVMGSQLRGDAATLLERAAESRAFVEAVPEEDLAALGVPRLVASPGLIDAQRTRRFLSKRYGPIIPEMVPTGTEPPLPDEVITGIAISFFRESSAENATDLMEGCLRHSHELVRVAAAIAYHQRSPERERLTRVLESGTLSTDELVRELAATGLAHIDHENARLSRLQGRTRGAAGGAPARTSLLVHGTWAVNSSWWQPPDGDFFKYLQASVFPDLYGGQDVFFWSGGWSDAARELAAGDLLVWVNNRNLQALNIIAHSHGGNVAMRATQLCLSSRKLVLLSCPVHFPKYLPDFTKVGDAVSVRVHLDLVILADQGGQRFRHPQIRENVLPIWFDHTATHNPDVWRNHNVPSRL